MGYANWSKAPKGAKYHTVDYYGVGEWWNLEPHESMETIWDDYGFIAEYTHGIVPNWRNTLERKPDGLGEPDSAGWMSWAGNESGECPLPDGTLLELQIDSYKSGVCVAPDLRWKLFGTADITAVRIIKTAAEAQNSVPKKTPAQLAGFEVGDAGIIKENRAGFKKGQKVTLYRDDKTTQPLWRGENSKFSLCDGMEGAYYKVFDIEKVHGNGNASDESLTGSKLYRAVSKAIESDEKASVFEYKSHVGGRWMKAERWETLIGIISKNLPVRLKPKQKMTWIEGPGGRYEYPMPLREAPDNGTIIYVAWRLVREGTEHNKYNEVDSEWLTQGRIHLTEEARDQHEKAFEMAQAFS